MRRNAIYALVFIVTLAFIVLLVDVYVQPSLPTAINRIIVVFIAAILAILAAVAGFKDTLELFGAIFQSRREDDFSEDGQEKTKDTGSVSELAHKESQLPTQSYSHLYGRDLVISECLEALQDSKGKHIVAIDGMGGIGKTALAREIALRCLRDGVFSQVFWEQAPKQRLMLPEETLFYGEELNYGTILDSLARKFKVHDIISLTLKEKEFRLRILLNESRVLVVLDNLETAGTDQDEIAERLRALLGPSKALLTSRRRFSGNVYAVHLGGLSEESSVELLRSEGEQKHIEQVTNARLSSLLELAVATGGSPLALKLVAGQLAFLPLDAVLAMLREVQLPTPGNPETEYLRFYKDIFLPSWELLSPSAKVLLVNMAIFPPNVGGKLEALKAISGLNEVDLVPLIDELWRLSFLEVGHKSSIVGIRYFLHPLTHSFVQSEIIDHF